MDGGMGNKDSNINDERCVPWMTTTTREYCNYLGNDNKRQQHPLVKGFVKLVVKSYWPCAGGGMGSFLCGIQVGEMMLGTMNGKLIIHGSAAVLESWPIIRLVAGGTGIAPLLQIAIPVLESRNPVDALTTVHLLFVKCCEEDILPQD
jgi:hypothetical protein